MRFDNETEVERHPVDPTNKTIQSGKIKYCCSVDYENMEFQAISWEDIEYKYKEDHKLNSLRQAIMDNDHEQILELLKAHRIKSKTTGLLEAIKPENLSFSWSTIGSGCQRT